MIHSSYYLEMDFGIREMDGLSLRHGTFDNIFSLVKHEIFLKSKLPITYLTH